MLMDNDEGGGEAVGKLLENDDHDDHDDEDNDHGAGDGHGHGDDNDGSQPCSYTMSAASTKESQRETQNANLTCIIKLTPDPPRPTRPLCYVNKAGASSPIQNLKLSCSIYSDRGTTGGLNSCPLKWALVRDSYGS